MKSLSEFMPRCDPSFNELGFDRADFMALLGRGSDAALTATTTTTKWVRGLYHRQWFSMLEAACIIEGEEPDAFDDCREYDLPNNIKHMQQAIRDALPELETDDYRNVSSRSIDAWCIANGISWPLMERYQSPPVAGTTDAASFAQRLAEAEQKAARLEQELAAAIAKRDGLWEQSFNESEVWHVERRMLEAEAMQWKAKADELQSLLCIDEDPDIEASSAVRASQIRFIVATAKALGYEPLAIPDGGKTAIWGVCKGLPALFTEDGFKHAWKAATSGYVRMANHDQFAKR